MILDWENWKLDLETLHLAFCPVQLQHAFFIVKNKLLQDYSFLFCLQWQVSSPTCMKVQLAHLLHCSMVDLEDCINHWVSKREGTFFAMNRPNDHVPTMSWRMWTHKYNTLFCDHLFPRYLQKYSFDVFQLCFYRTGRDVQNQVGACIKTIGIIQTCNMYPQITRSMPYYISPIIVSIHSPWSFQVKLVSS